VRGYTALDTMNDASTGCGNVYSGLKNDHCSGVDLSTNFSNKFERKNTKYNKSERDPHIPRLSVTITNNNSG
jgi:hypothetical protein